jgi:hypothetical protein
VRKGPEIWKRKEKTEWVEHCRLVLIGVMRESEDGSVHTLGRLVSGTTVSASLKQDWSQGS